MAAVPVEMEVQVVIRQRLVSRRLVAAVEVVRMEGTEGRVVDHKEVPEVLV